MAFSCQELDQGIEFLKKYNLYENFAIFKIPMDETLNIEYLLSEEVEYKLAQELCIKNTNAYVLNLLYYIQNQDEQKMDDSLDDDDFDKIIHRCLFN